MTRNTANRLYAEGAAVLSQASAHVPAVGRLVIGHHPAVTPVGYHVARTRASDIIRWAEFSGDEAAGFLPASYHQVGIVRARRVDLDVERVKNPDGRLAVAWALGEAVMVSEVPEGVRVHTSEDSVAFGMRIGRDALRAAAGIWTPDNQLHVPEETGAIQAGRRLSLAEVPPHLIVF
jgi:hypothetical protein